MKRSIPLLATMAFVALSLLTTNAAMQVYDLKADWSDTENPNGTWSYYSPLGGGLMINVPFPWVDPIYGADPFAPKITRTTDATVVPGYLELGDVAVFGDVWIFWTAPVSGTVNMSGVIWSHVPDCLESGLCSDPFWALTHNGSVLSDGYAGTGFRSSPDVLSSGSGGAAALQNIPVNGGDQVVLGLFGGWHFGVNFTITLTPDSVDPVTAIENLALAVVDMNLQNGIENSLDSKLDAALNALVDANFNNDSAACNSLAAFISAVEAQRGNKITSAQADQLIPSAQEIQTLLNCGN